MTHDAAFLEAIAANPDDDGLRLVYADWLEERDDPRGEFIRVQIELARMAEDDPRWLGLKKREQELLEKYQSTWLGVIDEHGVAGNFGRGFLVSAIVPAQTLIEFEQEVARLGPLGTLAISGLDADLVPQLAASSALSRATGLDLCEERLAAEELKTLLQSPHLAGLKELLLCGSGLGPDGAEAVAATAPKGLRILNLACNELGATGVEILAGNTRLDALSELILNDNRLTVAATEFLAGARQLENLSSLSLATNQIRPTGMRFLAGAEWLSGLRSLDLSQNPVESQGVDYLARSSVLSNLRRLGLAHARLGVAGARSLARSTALVHLTDVDLSGNQLGTEGAELLARAECFAHLTHLNLSGNEIGDDGAKVIASSALLANLTALILAYNGLRVFGVKEITASPYLTRLETLNLQGNCLGDMGLQRLARWPRLSQLVRLNLRDNRIGDLGVNDLAASPYAGRLRELDLSNNPNISDAGWAALAASPLAPLVTGRSQSRPPAAVPSLPSPS
jgi:uncharacterized protein (TIGR02996 family)